MGKKAKARYATINNRSLVVRLVSAAGTGYFYTTTRRRAIPKLNLMKFDPLVNKHVLFTESKK